MSQSPRDFFTTVETRLGNAGLSAAGISQNIQNIISNDQVTRRQVSTSSTINQIVLANHTE